MSAGREDSRWSDSASRFSTEPSQQRSSRVEHRARPYHSRQSARRSLQDALSPDIQLAQNFPQPTPAASITLTHGGTDVLVSPLLQRSSARSRHAASIERTPPARRSPRLANLASSGDGSATPNPSPSARVAPISETTALAAQVVRRSLRLVQQSVPSDDHLPLGESAPDNSSLYLLVVKPIVKTALSQRDSSGEELEIYAVEGRSFSDILKKLWEKFRAYMKGKAVKADGKWTVEVPDMEEWNKMMQFKPKRHVVDSAKTEQSWNTWLHAVNGQGVNLLVYEYGAAIKTLPALVAFKKECVVPLSTDRAGAASELSLQEVTGRLQQQWESIFQGAAIVWRMWANHLMRNLDRSTWDSAIEKPPPTYVARLLRAADSRVEQRTLEMTRSANLALECVNAALAANEQLLQDWESFGVRLKENSKCLVARQAVIEGFISNVLPPRDVIDPLETMENIDDVDHE